MNGGTLQGAAVFGVAAGWDVAGMGDLNGDGTADVLWRQPATGLVGIWFMNGGTIVSTATFSPGTAWAPVGAG